MPLFHYRLIYISIAASFLLTMISCGTTYHAQHDMSLNLSEKGDLKATGSVNQIKRVSDKPFFSGQVAYSPIKHLAVSAKHFSYKEFRGTNSNSIFEFSETAEGGFTELAIGGYYGPKFRNNKDDEHINFAMPKRFTGDLYLGASKGSLNLKYGSMANERLNFNRMFAHIGIHFQSDIFKISYAFKLVSLNYKKVILNGDVPDESYLDVQQLVENNPLVYKSSSLRVQLGVRHIQFYIDMTFDTLPDYMNTLYFDDKLASAGLIIDINEFWKKNTIPKI